jgi:hypothetical protein
VIILIWDYGMWIWGENASEPYNLRRMKVKSSEVGFATIDSKNLTEFSRKIADFNEHDNFLRPAHKSGPLLSLGELFILKVDNWKVYCWVQKVSLHENALSLIGVVTRACD